MKIMCPKKRTFPVTRKGKGKKGGGKKKKGLLYLLSVKMTFTASSGVYAFGMVFYTKQLKQEEKKGKRSHQEDGYDNSD